MKLSVKATVCLATPIVMIIFSTMNVADALSPLVPVSDSRDPCFPIIMCKCPYGTTWSIDTDGCPRCSCKPKPLCPLYKCPAIDCPHGMAKDDNGCPTCSCAPGPICPEPFCPFIKCANGLATDANGCKICRCKPYVCPAVLCDIHCPHGYIKDSKGCNTCRCKPVFPICPPLCRMHCPNGFVRDSSGCRICKCNPFKPVCPDIVCPAVACPRGFENHKDKNGCRIGCGCRKIGLPEM